MFKDLQVLYQSLKASKFFRLCIQTHHKNDIPETILDITADDQNLNQEQIVKLYRDLLNYFYKLFAKLNIGAEQLTQKNELFRLKLLN